MTYSSRTRSSIYLLVAMLSLALAAGVQAKGGPHKPSNKPKEEIHHTTVESISADSITIKEAKASKTFKIGKDTEFSFKGQKVKLEEIKPGMRVSVSVGADPKIAARIAADEPPKTSKDAKK